MNLIRNKKFLSMVENLKFTTHNKKEYIDSIQFEDNYTISVACNKQPIKNLLNLFNKIESIKRLEKSENYNTGYGRNGNDRNGYDRNVYDRNGNDRSGYDRAGYDNTKKIIRKKNTSFFDPNDIETKSLKINYLNLLIKSVKDLDIIHSNKTGDYYSDIFFKSIDNLYSTLDNGEKIEYIKNIKLKTVDIFNKQGFYKKYNYSLKDFKKSQLDLTFTMNESIMVGMLKVYADVFSINLIYKNENNTNQYMNNFNKNRVTVILYESTDKIFSIKKKGRFVRGIELENFLHFEKKPIKEIMEKMKTPDLHNIARMFAISTKTMGKDRKINKIKANLIKEILL